MSRSKLHSRARAPEPASASSKAKHKEFLYVLTFFALFTVPLIAMHGALLDLPYFWDEHGQFIPTALDLLRTGSWIAHSTIPNIHPPGVEAYLVVWYKVFGYSVAITRIAMLLVSGFGLLLTFLIALHLGRRMHGLAAFYPVVFLGISPLFFTQSMMAQLDAPAMVLTLLAILLFLEGRHLGSALACVALVLVKETGAVTPAALFFFLAWKREWRKAILYMPAPAALAAWLFVLHHTTGYWMGNPGFEHYNVAYSLQPVRVAITIVRRIYYLLFAEFRWIGLLAIVLSARQLWKVRSSDWTIIGLVCAANLLIVMLLGGAALERYLLPVLPFFYILVGMALVLLPAWKRAILAGGLGIGLIANFFWNPPYPFPFEDNYAMVDFVELQRVAAGYLEEYLPNANIATAWPYTSALRNPDFGYVHRPLHVVETADLAASSVRAVPAGNYDVLAVYTRTWTPAQSVTDIQFVRALLERYYNFEPEIDEAQCVALGLWPKISWERRGQMLTIYTRQKPGL